MSGKLTLHLETLRRLTDAEQQAQVRGGENGPTLTSMSEVKQDPLTNCTSE